MRSGQFSDKAVIHSGAHIVTHLTKKNVRGGHLCKDNGDRIFGVRRISVAWFKALKDPGMWEGSQLQHCGHVLHEQKWICRRIPYDVSPKTDSLHTGSDLQKHGP